jgi:hypothetical protein
MASVVVFGLPSGPDVRQPSVYEIAPDGWFHPSG